jgi:hypothetical protein
VGQLLDIGQFTDVINELSPIATWSQNRPMNLPSPCESLIGLKNSEDWEMMGDCIGDGDSRPCNSLINGFDDEKKHCMCLCVMRGRRQIIEQRNQPLYIP